MVSKDKTQNPFNPVVRVHDEMPTIQDFSRYRTLESRLAGCYFVESSYPPEFKLPRHSHDYTSFYLVLNGGLTEHYQKESQEYGPLTFVYLPPDEIHWNQAPRAGGRCVRFEIRPEWLDYITAYLPLPNHLIFQDGATIIAALKLYREFRCPDALSPLAVEGLILELLAELSRKTILMDRKPPRWLEHIQEFIQTHFTNQLDIHDLAQVAGVHQAHLATVFRRHFRCTIGEYVRRLRIEFACRQIATSEQSLTEIGSMAGFYDLSHFSKVFHQTVGLSIAEYRMLFQK